jgi:4-amino-4-deoxy-L-arabinose transferase-like glycosyltransferase
MTAVGREEAPRGRHRLAVGLVLVFALVVLAIPLGRAPIWESNDARYVLLARDMVDHGHWLVPLIREAPTEGVFKPQLYTWSIALASLPSGRVTEFTAALPSALSAIAGVVGVFAIGTLLWSVRAGVMAGLILTTTPHYFVFAHHSLADVMMTAFMVWALYFLLRARSDSSRRSLLGFYACVGAAMLSKGAPGLAALVAATVATWLEGGRPALQKLRPAVGALMLMVLAVPWVVPYLVTARPVFVNEVLIAEYSQWFLGPHGLTYRIAHMPSVFLYFLPWTLFLPAAIAWWRRNGPDHGRRYIWWWTLTLWMLIGMSGTYRARYYLPVYPGLALLAAEFFAWAEPRLVRRELWLGALGFVLVVMAVLVTIFPVSLTGEGPVYVPDTVGERVAVAGLAVMGAMAVVILARRQRLMGVGVAIACVLGAILAIEGHTSPVRRARYYDVPAIGAVANARTPSDGTVIGHPDLSLEYDVYIDRRIVEIGSPEELARRLSASSQDVVIMTGQRWATLAPALAPGWRVLGSRTVGNRELVVVGSSPDGDVRVDVGTRRPPSR